MKYQLKCPCGATCWVKGNYDGTVNAVELDCNHEWEWEGGIEGCVHDDYEIVNEETDDDDFVEGA